MTVFFGITGLLACVPAWIIFPWIFVGQQPLQDFGTWVVLTFASYPVVCLSCIGLAWLFHGMAMNRASNVTIMIPWVILLLLILELCILMGNEK